MNHLIVFYIFYLLFPTDILKDAQIKKIEIKETKQFQLGNILDFYIDKSSNLYLTDNYGLYKLDYKGEYLNSYLKKGSGPGEFTYPRKLFVTDKKRIIIEDMGNHKFIVLDSNFKYLSEFRKKNINPVTEFYVSSNLLITYAFDAEKYPINIYDFTTGQFVREFGVPSPYVYKFEAFDSGGGLAVKDNYIYYMHTHQYKIFKYSMNGQLITTTSFIPSHFKTIHKKPDFNHPFNIDYSSI